MKIEFCRRLIFQNVDPPQTFHTKFEPKQFSRFGVNWIPTNKQLNRKTPRQTTFFHLCINTSNHANKCTFTKLMHNENIPEIVFFRLFGSLVVTFIF